MLFYIIVIFLGIIVDQLTKLYATKVLSVVSTVPIIPNVIHLTYVENNGAAFSSFSGMQTFLIAITIILSIALIALLVVIPKTRRYFNTNLALAMIVSGAIGNLLDRLRLHFVVDFFDFRIIGFAIFNVADILVVIGCGLMVLCIWRGNYPQTLQELNLNSAHKK